MNANTVQWNNYRSLRQSRHTELHNCTRLPKFSHFRQNIAQLQMSGKIPPRANAIATNAITTGTNLSLINQLPAHAIICDFPLRLALFLSACYKKFIFLISHCWQIMARTKNKITNGYTRVRTVTGSTVTTHFIPPSPAMPLRGHFRQMESQILRNLIIIQEFNLANYTGPMYRTRQSSTSALRHHPRKL
jgi:hypothetical protein